jgi:hypothetical protein
MTKAERDVRRKLAVLNHAEQIGNISRILSRSATA